MRKERKARREWLGQEVGERDGGKKEGQRTGGGGGKGEEEKQKEI